MLEPGEPLPGDADLVLLPGSKATLGDIAALRAEGWDIDILAHVRRGGWVLGLCGGYQMLGRRDRRPAGAGGRAGRGGGLGLLEVETVLEPVKVLALRDVARGAVGRGGARLRDPYGPHGGPGWRGRCSAPAPPRTGR